MKRSSRIFDLTDCVEPYIDREMDSFPLAIIIPEAPEYKQQVQKAESVLESSRQHFLTLRKRYDHLQSLLAKPLSLELRVQYVVQRNGLKQQMETLSRTAHAHAN